MGIYRCSSCKHIGEHVSENITTKCEKCVQVVKVYNTLFFVKNIMNRWTATVRELNVLKAQELDEEETSQKNRTSDEYNLLNDAKLSETDILATKAQHDNRKMV